jgi:acyl carrier protein
MTRPEPLSARDIESWMVARLAAALRVHPRRIDPLADLPSLSLDSMQAVELSAQITQWLGRAVPPTLLWDHPTIRDLSRHLAEEQP